MYQSLQVSLTFQILIILSILLQLSCFIFLYLPCPLSLFRFSSFFDPQIRRYSLLIVFEISYLHLWCTVCHHFNTALYTHHIPPLTYCNLYRIQNGWVEFSSANIWHNKKAPIFFNRCMGRKCVGHQIN